MKRKTAIFTVLSIFLLSLCLLGCQHGDSGTTSAADNAKAIALKEQGDAHLRASNDALRRFLDGPPGHFKESRDNVARRVSGHRKRAIEAYTEALEINPQYAEAYYGRGKAYGGGDQAIADFTVALRINPQYAEAYCMRGIAYGICDQAIADYNAALQINPQYYDAYMSKGQTYEGLGRKTEAIEVYRQALLRCSNAADKDLIQERISKLTAQ